MNRSLVVTAIVFSFAGHAWAGGQSKLVQTIPLPGVEGRIDHLAADPQRKRVYIAALGNESLEVVDLEAGKRIRSVGGLKKPTGVRVVPPAGNVLVGSGEDGMVRLFSPDHDLLGKIEGLDDADNVRLDADGKRAYVGYGEGALAVIDTQHLRKLGDIKLPAHPESFQLEAHGARIFVNVPGAHCVAVVDREKRTILEQWPIKDAQANFPMALDEANHRLFVGCRQPAKLLVLDTTTGKTIFTLDCCGDTDDVFYDDKRESIYVSGGAGCITLIDGKDANKYRVVTSVPTAAGARTSLWIPELSQLCVAVPHRQDQPAELRVYEPRLR